MCTIIKIDFFHVKNCLNCIEQKSPGDPNTIPSICIAGFALSRVIPRIQSEIIFLEARTAWYLGWLGTVPCRYPA
jgi:hypothetical protein